MILPILLVVSLVGMALGSAVPMGLGAARQGRLAGWELAVDEAARGGLADAELGWWTAAATAVPLGGVLTLPPLGVRPRLDVAREARRLSGELWLLTARAELRAAGGDLLARSEQGLLVRLVGAPSPAPPTVRAVVRAWFRRPS
jgi:hypothetical protein